MSKSNYKSKYRAILVDGVKHDYHRWLMEQELGRKLSSDEIVHHINGDTMDNRIENLEVMMRSDHTKLHQAGRKVADWVKKAQSERMVGRPNKACRKLSDEDVRYIRTHYTPRDPNFGLRPLSKKYGIDHSALYRIIQGLRYVDIE